MKTRGSCLKRPTCSMPEIVGSFSPWDDSMFIVHTVVVVVVELVLH